MHISETVGQVLEQMWASVGCHAVDKQLFPAAGLLDGNMAGVVISGLKYLECCALHFIQICVSPCRCTLRVCLGYSDH
jgi:hypothetical protein